MSRATHAITHRFCADHIGSVGKQRLQQSGKYRVNEKGEEISRVPENDTGSHVLSGVASPKRKCPERIRAFFIRNDCRLRLAGDFLAKRGLRRREARDRHAVRRARNIIEPNLMAERN